jgi:hypothetical protein
VSAARPGLVVLLALAAAVLVALVLVVALVLGAVWAAGRLVAGAADTARSIERAMRP